MSVNGRRNGDDLFASSIAAGMTIAAAAAAAGIAERTAYSRLSEPGFKARIATIRADMVSQATARLSAAMTRSAERLAELAESQDEKVALTACRSVLELGTRLRESEELESRIAELEGRLKERRA